MKYAVTFLLCIFCLSTAKADYRYMKLCEMLRNADYGAIGTIVNIDKNYFYLKVDKYVLSKLEMDTLPIVKFENWPCGRRYADYKVGQKEIVFFRKSNYVINDFELLGYGGGDEYELPIFKDTIKYQRSYGELKSYQLDQFLKVISDYNQLVNSKKEIVNQQSLNDFSEKSEIHHEFIACKVKQEVKDFDIPENGVIVNLERNYLYEDYENKIFISNSTKDSIYVKVEDAEVWKEGNYFVVKPRSGWTRRWLNVYSTRAKNEQDVLLNQIFEVIQLPEPTIYFGHSIKDTIYFSYFRDAIPTLAYYLDDLHKDEYLQYHLLNYEYEIYSNGQSETFKIKSEYGTKGFQDRLMTLQSGDTITLRNIFALYPDNSVKKIKDKTIIVKRD